MLSEKVVLHHFFFFWNVMGLKRIPANLECQIGMNDVSVTFSVLLSSQFLPPTSLWYLMFPTIPRGTPTPAYNYPFISLLMCQKTMVIGGGYVKWSDIPTTIKLNWAQLSQPLLVSFLGTSHFKKKKWHRTTFSESTVITKFNLESRSIFAQSWSQHHWREMHW